MHVMAMAQNESDHTTENEEQASEDPKLDQKLSAALAEQYGCMSDSFRRFTNGSEK